MSSKIIDRSIGIIIGIVLSIIVIGIGGYTLFNNLKAQTVANYGDEYHEVQTVLANSKNPVFQKNYILAGLTLSSDFQDFLAQGVESGVWTEDFLNQVVLDDVLDVYKAQYAGTFKLIADTPDGQKAKEILQKLFELKGTLSAIDFSQVMYLIHNLVSHKELIISLINRLANIVEYLKTVNSQELRKQITDRILQDAHVQHLIKEIAAFKVKVMTTVNKVTSQINSIINKIEEITDGNIKKYIIEQIQHSAIYIKIKEEIQAIINKINSITLEQIKQAILAFLLTLPAVNGLIEKILSIIAYIKGITIQEVEAYIIDLLLHNPTINQIINKIEELIAYLKGISVDDIKEFIKANIKKLVDIYIAAHPEIVAFIQKVKEIVTALKGMTIDDIKAYIINLILSNHTVQEIIAEIKSIIAYINGITSDDIKNFIKGIINYEIAHNSALQALIAKVKVILADIDDFKDKLDTLLQDIDADHVFTEPFTIGGITIPAKLLNAIDLEVDTTTVVYDNNGTLLNLKDDTLTINDLYLSFEIDHGKRVDLITKPVVIEGNSASIVNLGIPGFNNYI